MEVKDLIKNRRIELGLTMYELADKIGVSAATISRWESGDIENMRRDKIAALAKALDISPALIMGWSDPADAGAYYDSDVVRAYAEKMANNPKYQVLFDTAANVAPEDIDLVTQLIKRFSSHD